MNDAANVVDEIPSINTVAIPAIVFLFKKIPPKSFLQDNSQSQILQDFRLSRANFENFLKM